MFSRRSLNRDILTLFALFFILIGMYHPAGAEEPPAPEAMEQMVAKVKPSLVRIHVVSADYSGGREARSETSGSGVIISAEGHVVTNHHVVSQSRRIFCTMADRKEIEADLTGTDPLSDIAVIKLRDKGNYPAAGFGDSSLLRVGERVFAMGSPLALSQSVTSGVISNTELIMPAFFGPHALLLDGEDVGSMVRWIGHDASIFPGNSGGPLVNTRGEIVGINEINLGLAGAIPGNLAREMAAQIIRRGRVVRSWVGLELQPLLRKQADGRGVLVSGAVPGSPAEKAGFKSGDILLSLDGRDISVRFGEEMPVLNQAIASIPVSSRLEAIISREGRELKLQVVTAERETAMGQTVEMRRLGICATVISPTMARQMGRENTEGVLVFSTRPGGPVDDAKPKINPGDIITSFDGKKVSGLKDLTDALALMPDADLKPVLVGYDRNSEHRLAVVEVGDRPDHGPGREASRAWLPLSVQAVTRNLADVIGLKDRTGLRVTQVYNDPQVPATGLQVGDIILAVAGEKVTARRPEDSDILSTMLRKHDIDEEVELTVYRESREMPLKVKLIASPTQDWEMRRFTERNLEFTARDISYMDRVRSGRPDDKGVLVEAVVGGGWAALADMQAGDVLVTVNGSSLETLDKLEEKMKDIAGQKPASVVFGVMREGQHLFIEVLPAWD